MPVYFNFSGGNPTNQNYGEKKNAKEAKSKQVVKSIKVKAVPLETVHQDEIILVKMRGFCEWPARVVQIKGNAIHVQFFGDSTTHTTTMKNTFSLTKNYDLVLNNLRGRKNPLYAKAIKEMEAILDIPADESLFSKL